MWRTVLWFGMFMPGTIGFSPNRTKTRQPNNQNEPPDAPLTLVLLDPPPRGGGAAPDCGGVARQWGVWGGRCGICGDEWGITGNAPHERPGPVGRRYPKGGVLALTRQLAVEYGPHNIRVNAVSPGTIATPLIQRILKERGTTEQEAGMSNCVQRIGRPEEVARVVCFLASQEASFMTGENVTVDGGVMAIGNWAKVA